MRIDESKEFLKKNLDVIDEATVKYLHECTEKKKVPY